MMWTQLGRVALAFGLAACWSSGLSAQSFSLDDDPFPFGGTGKGAEDEFGLTAAAPLTPSPSLGLLAIPTDGTIVSGAVGGLEQAPNGVFIDAFSTNHFSPALLNAPAIHLDFSVDRLTTGLPGSASLGEFLVGQQPGDIYTSTSSFINPAFFVGGLGVGPFVGALPSAGVGGSNALLIDESAFGLTTAAGIVPPGAPGGAIVTGSHDNVDAFDFVSQVPEPLVGPPAGVYPTHSYFAINPDEAFFTGGVSAADIFDTAAFAPGTSPIPYATSFSMGLDPTINSDSIDALVVFDGGTVGGPSNGGPGAEPGLDFALFSLAPGSLSLSTYGLSAGDIFFTDFTGAFGVFAFDTDIGLMPGAPGFPFQQQTNVDALEVTPVPEPTALGLLALGLLGWAGNRRR